MKYKLKVERQFRDKNTGKLQKVGKTIVVSEDRGKELLSHPQGIVSLVEQVAEKGDEKPSEGDSADKNDAQGEPENKEGSE